MNDFLSSLKADLLERRTLALLGLLVAALVGAVAYAALGGGSSTAPPPASSPGAGAGVGAAGIVAVPAPPNSRAALAEVTSGAPLQRGGGSRDPFTPLPGSAATVSSPSSSTKSKGSGSSSSSSGTSKASKPTHEASEQPEKQPSKPAKPNPVYRVEVRFGTIAAGTPPQSAQLSPYDLKARQALPSTGVPLVAFDGVVTGGRRAKFKLVGESFLRGTAACVPSVSLCQAITLAPGQSEELEYLPPGAPPVVYELQVVKITPKGASAATLRHARAALAGKPRAAVATSRSTGALAGYGSAFATSSVR
jgi:hypothetical protein